MTEPKADSCEATLIQDWGSRRPGGPAAGRNSRPGFDPGNQPRAPGMDMEMNQQERRHPHLREAEEHLGFLFDHAQVGVFQYDLKNNKFLYCNNPLAQMFGYVSREEFLRDFNPAEHFVDPETPNQLAKALQGGRVENFASCCRRRDGSRLWLRWSARLDPDSRHLEGVVCDITELQEARDALRASEGARRHLREQLLGRSVLHGLEGLGFSRRLAEEKNRLYRVLTEVEEGVAGFDRDFAITFWNPVMERLSGLGREEAVGQHLLQVLPALQASKEPEGALGGGQTGGLRKEARLTRLTPAAAPSVAVRSMST